MILQIKSQLNFLMQLKTVCILLVNLLIYIKIITLLLEKSNKSLKLLILMRIIKFLLKNGGISTDYLQNLLKKPMEVVTIYLENQESNIFYNHLGLMELPVLSMKMKLMSLIQLKLLIDGIKKANSILLIIFS